MSAYLPVLGLALQHQGILGLADIAIIVLLDLLGLLLGLNTVILGESTLMPSTAGMGEEMRSHGFDGALGGGGDGPDGFEVLLGCPSLGEDGQRPGYHRGRCHYFFCCLYSFPTLRGFLVALVVVVVVV